MKCQEMAGEFISTDIINKYWNKDLRGEVECDSVRDLFKSTNSAS
jgi:hypothetical protein